MPEPRRRKPKHPLLDTHYMEGFLGFGTPEDPVDVEAMPWPARVATFLLAFDGQMGNGGAQFWITNEWRVHDAALLDALGEIRSPLAREVSKYGSPRLPVAFTFRRVLRYPPGGSAGPHHSASCGPGPRMVTREYLGVRRHTEGAAGTVVPRRLGRRESNPCKILCSLC